MRPPVAKILIDRESLERRIIALAEDINRLYQNEELVLISVLKGSVMFLSDLMKELDLDVQVGFLYLSSYRGETSPQCRVQRHQIPFPDIKDRHVLVVEDIYDSGASLEYAVKLCVEKQPKSLRTCVLLVKEGIERKAHTHIDFCGFDIPNEFVVGYGLDYQERYRHLPFIAVPEL